MKIIRNILLISVVLSSVLISASCVRESKGNLEVGDKVPEFELTSDIYGTVSNKDLKDEVTLLCFFATWCPPCQLELAAIQEKLMPAFGSADGFRLIVVGREHTDDELTEYNQTKGFTFPLYPDPERAVYSKFADQTIPRAYLIDRKGVIIDASVGFDEDHFSAMMDKISSMLVQK